MSRSANKRPIAVIDCETDPFQFGREIKPFAWGFFDGTDYIQFWGDTSTEQLADFLADKKYMIFAHNGGKFDYWFLLNWLEKTNVKVINGRLSQMKLGENILRDSYNIIPMPLASYNKIEIEYWKMERQYREIHKAEILQYLEGDCRYLFDLVEAFTNRFGRKLTLAGAAMTELLHTIPPLEKFNLFTDSKYRPYYYGGRCQAFQTGHIKRPLVIYDINSAYPFAMTHQHPDPCFNSWTIGTKLPKEPPYFATIKAISRGCLPYRNEKTKALDFPDDNEARIYHVTGWEIKAGLETDSLKILEVLEVRYPDKTRDFSEYVNKFYDEKKSGTAKKKEGEAEGDKQKEMAGIIEELFAKLMLNSSYGKYAQDPLTYEDWQIVDEGGWPEYTAGEAEKLKEEGVNPSDPTHNKIEVSESGRLVEKVYTWQFESTPAPGIELYRRPSPDPHGYYNVAVAASITGFVRAYLWRAIKASKGVVYCDTDSLVCEVFEGDEGLELGQWKGEGTATDSFVAGKKLYALWTGQGETDFNVGVNVEKNGKTIAFDMKAAKKAGWKIASKGVRLTPYELAYAVKTGKAVKWDNFAPSFSLTHGVRYLSRNVKMNG